MYGERYDLMKVGQHVLIHIPRGQGPEHTLLRVVADALRMGGSCADIYFQEINITGSWALATRRGGYHYVSSSDADEAPQWLTLGKVMLKVVHGRTRSGTSYLNLFVKHLGRAGCSVGGLLGEDDHSDEATPPAECQHRIGLHSEALDVSSHSSSTVSVGVATLA